MKGKNMKKMLIMLCIIAMIMVYFLSNKLLHNEKTSFLAITVDGNKVDSIPTSGYYDLTSYTCNNGTIITWDKKSKRIALNYSDVGTNKEESCILNFTTSATILLNTVNIGDYVLYEGSNGCDSTINSSLDTIFNSQCKGLNVSYVDSSNMGSCDDQQRVLYSVGWRVAYKLDSNSDGTSEVYLVSGGTPACVTGDTSVSANTIASLNTESIKYCNSNYAYGSGCQSTYNTAGSNYNSWAMKGLDFYQMTLQLFGTGRRLYTYDTATEASSGAVCYNVKGSKACGYNNDLIDNGGWVWYGSSYSSTETLVSYYNREIFRDSVIVKTACGVRPVIHLKQTIYITGGNGTMSDPYTIGY